MAINIAKNVKALRKQKGITQEELAEKTELSRSTIAKIENNWKFPSFEAGLRIAQALDTTCENLAYGTDNREED